jgi:tRNA-binding protein
MQDVTYEDFTKVHLAVGMMTDAQDFPEARRRAYKLWIDFGEEIGTKKTSAQITDHYTLETLI